MKKVFGKRAAAVPVTAIKSMIGETFSASGALSLSATVGMLERGFIPATKNYEKRDPDCDLDYVSQNSRDRNMKNVLVLSSDPYGGNAAMVLGRL
jgi:3-oxoacyl-(acyl-carrier-protein) synthase